MEDEALKRKERLRALREKAKAPKDEAPVPMEEEEKTESIPAPVLPAIDTEVQPQLEAMKQPMLIEEIDLANLAPRKPDWDLKRDIAKKLEKLDRRTQRAIAELIRERLKEGQTDSLLASVNVATSHVAGVVAPEDKYKDYE